jgi:hypothetical protein
MQNYNAFLNIFITSSGKDSYDSSVLAELHTIQAKEWTRILAIEPGTGYGSSGNAYAA